MRRLDAFITTTHTRAWKHFDVERTGHNLLQTICQSIDDQRDTLIDTLAAHIAIPTGHNHTVGVAEYREQLLRRLRAIGATIERRDGAPRPDWLLGTDPDAPIPATTVCRHAAPGKPRILLVGHLDTVFPPDGPFQHMTIADDGKTAIGPGVVDMKGGILIAVTALEALHAAGVEIDWTYVLNEDEEVGSFASVHVLAEEARKADVGLVTEPSLPGGELAIERKGSGQFRIDVHGRSAHAGRAFFDGCSAVYALGEILSKLEAMSDADRGVTVNVGPIVGGDATNVVPDHAVAWGNVRFPDQESADELGRIMDALKTPDDAMPRVTVRRDFNRPAKPRTEAVDRLAGIARSVATDLGQELPFASTGGVCDGNVLQNAGLPTIDTLGVRGGGLHTTDEWIELDSLTERAKLMACLLVQLTEVWDE